MEIFCRSQSPRSGAMFLTIYTKKMVEQAKESQSPRSGAMFLTQNHNPNPKRAAASLNPLEAGQCS